MWQQILKAELASQSGYAQLDFDNIVEEEEANCKEILRELHSKLRKIRFDVQINSRKHSAILHEHDGNFLRFYPKNGSRINSIYHAFDDTLPEEVYCKAIEQFKESGERFFTTGFEEYIITTASSPLGSMIIISKGRATSTVYPPTNGQTFVYLRYFAGRYEAHFPEIAKKLEAAFNVV